MQTRKSSPLPNPNDTLNKYRINYQIHYQNLHQYLLSRIHREIHEKNLLIKEFNRLTKVMSRKEESIFDNSQSMEQVNKQVRKEVRRVFEQISRKELDIHKLYEEDEGVILQLCDLLKVKEEQMKKYRQNQNKQHKSSEVSFLHYGSFPINVNQSTDSTKTLQQKDMQNSFSNQEKQETNNSHSSQNKVLIEFELNSHLEYIKENQTEQTAFNSIKVTHEINGTQEQQQIPKMEENHGIDKDFETQFKNNILNQFNKDSVNELKQDFSNELRKDSEPIEKKNNNELKENIQSIINQYKKNQETKVIEITQKGIRNIIEISSSADEQSCKKIQNIVNQQRSFEKIQGESKKIRLKKKKALKLCITLLD